VEINDGLQILCGACNCELIEPLWLIFWQRKI